jgi:PKD repeat protein
VATFSSATVKRSTFINSGLSTDTTSGIIALPGAFVNVFSSRFSGLSVAVNVASGTVGLNDSVIDLRSRTGARGVDVDNPSASGTGSRVANLDGVTVVGTGDSQLGLRVAAETSNAAGENATGVARNSLFLLTGAGSTDLYCAQGASNASSQLNMFNSLVRVSAPLLTGSCGNSQSGNLPSDIPGSEVQASDLFVNSAGGDLRLRKGAIVIDQGVAANDASLAGRGFDAYGYLRVIGSNVDMGGSEYENHEPARPTLTPSATTTVAGTAIDFSADASDPNGDALTYDWNFGDGTVANGKTTSHTFTQPGTYTVSVAASDFDLQGSAAEVLITVTAPPSTGGGGGGTTLPIPEAVLSFTKPTCKFKSPKKTKNGFTVNAAKVKDCYIQQRSSAAHSYMFRLERTAAGYMIGGTCKAKQGKTGSAKRCNLPLKGSQLIEIPAETSYLTFGGKWNKKTLPSGKYTVVAVNPNTPTSKITVNLIYKAKQGSTGRTK